MALATTHIFILAAAFASVAGTASAHEHAYPTPTKGCTTTMTLTLSRLPTPPYWPQCVFDGTLRIYPATVTVDNPEDCHGCTHIRVTEVPEVHCPAKIITATVTEVTPKTTYRSVCSTSTSKA